MASARWRSTKPWRANGRRSQIAWRGEDGGAGQEQRGFTAGPEGAVVRAQERRSEQDTAGGEETAWKGGRRMKGRIAKEQSDAPRVVIRPSGAFEKRWSRGSVAAVSGASQRPDNRGSICAREEISRSRGAGGLPLVTAMGGVKMATTPRSERCREE